MEKTVSRKVGIAVIIVGVVFVLSAAAALAASEARPIGIKDNALPSSSATSAILDADDPITDTDDLDLEEPITRTNMVASAISLFFNVPVSEVASLHLEGIGYGVIAKACFLAQDSGMTVDEILAYTDEMGWGEIAMYLGFDPGNKGRNLGMIVSGRGAVSGTVTLAAQRLADRLGADAEEVQALLAEGASPGAVAMAYKLADKYGAEPDDLLNQRLEGTSWGQIKKDLKASANETSTLSAGQGSPPGQANSGNQGQGNKGKNGKGQGQGQGRGHGHGKH
jgi:hypothetical protein